MGVRFTALLSGGVMLIGAVIKWYAVAEGFKGSGLEAWFTNNLNYIPGFDELGISPFYQGMPASAKLAAVGFMIFGCGVEMAGITVSRGIVKWFKGREIALAMGSEMALARLGVATCMIFSPFFAKLGGQVDVSRSVAFGVVLLMIALIMFIVYFFMDKKLDAQTGEAEEKDEPFKIKDIGKILSSGGFWLVALLCVLYYSAIFPFQKYAVNMLQCNLSFTPPAEGSFWAGNTVTIIQYCIMLVVAATAFAFNFTSKKSLKTLLLTISVIGLVVFCYMGYMRQSAETIFAVFPLLAVGITPILGKVVDNKGKAASMLMFGSILLIVCHLTFAFILPLFKDSAIGGVLIAYVTILILGASFSLVPASLWPSVPKLVDQKVIGSAYALIFWIQNIGLQHIDMPDVRKFLDKWVPAHLMYKIILLLDYSASIGEVFSVTEMTIGFDSPYWNVRRLNGTWLLDGTYNLGVGRKPDEWGISYDMGDVEVLESVELDVSVSATSQLQEIFTDAGVVIGFDSPYWNVRRLNGTWQMDGSYELNVLRKPDTYGLAIDLGNTNIEEMTPGGVVIKKDLWLLDGSYQLNGTRILDAIRREEEL